MAKWVSQLSTNHVVWVGDLIILYFVGFCSGSHESYWTLENLVKWYVRQGHNIGITGA